jgi:hypothetical protein
VDSKNKLPDLEYGPSQIISTLPCYSSPGNSNKLRKNIAEVLPSSSVAGID